MSMFSSDWHRDLIEHRGAWMAVATTVLVAVGSLIEIAPMFGSSIGPQPVEGVTPYTPLELAGRDVYISEGCYNCHSQMIRPFRSETLRYGTWTRAGETAYDHPFQLGSRRIGPDLARVGGKYPDAWHWQHMIDPRAITDGSIMPSYPWLAESKVDPDDIAASVRAMVTLGVPYSEAEVAGVAASLQTQAGTIVSNLKTAGIEAEPDVELVALIAYLQRLGKDGTAALAARETAP